MNIPPKPVGPSGALQVPALIGVLALAVSACAGLPVLGGWTALVELVAVAAVRRVTQGGPAFTCEAAAGR